jgi:uncharacterized membrane protein YidH (DUF202 family)
MTLVLLIALATSISCDGNRVTETIVNQAVITPKVDPPVFTTLDISPQFDTLAEGAEKQVNMLARDQRGHLIWTRGTLSFTSSDTAVARVTPYGFMTAVGGGTATISVKQTLVGVTLSATASVTVIPATPLSSVVLTADHTRGWQPAIAHLIAGGTVTWQISHPINWSGVAHEKVYLLDRDYREIASLDLSAGSATRKFVTPGAYRYCSGWCWDPPDFGVIYVH